MIQSILPFERKIYSQNGEDGIIEAIFNKIGVTNRFFVEFGVGPAWSQNDFLDVKEHGLECNTRLLKEKGWTGLLMDGTGYPQLDVKKERITADNINDLFQKYNVPSSFDLLSIDIDGNDYWVWKAITNFTPRVVVIEYNASIPPTESRVIKYDPNHAWDGTTYYGGSLLALTKLAQSKGYALVGCDSRGVNAFFVKEELAKEHFILKSLEQLYRLPTYNHPPTDKTMILI